MLMSFGPFLVRALLVTWLIAGCGGVTPIARSERAAIGASFLTVDYCVEPGNSADQVGDPLVLANPMGDASSPLYGVGAVETSPRGREIAEIMLFARESLYRVCEAQLNGTLDDDKAGKERASIVSLALTLIDKLNDHELARATREGEQTRRERLGLIQRLLAEIAVLDAQRSTACMAGDTACTNRQAELRERMANREALLKTLQPPP